jgi:hypothetical protein
VVEPNEQMDKSNTFRVKKIIYLATLKKFGLNYFYSSLFNIHNSPNNPYYRISFGRLDFAFFSFAFYIYPNHFAIPASYCSSFLIGLPASSITPVF